MNWTLLSLLNWTTDYFKKNNIESARLEAELLLAHLLKCNRIKIYMQFDRPMSEDELAQFKLLIQRRIKHEPLAYIVGSKEFWSLSFKVGPGVLVPRPETELIVETVKREASHVKREEELKILDFCTGSGNLAIVLAKEFPNAKIEAIDKSPLALDYAKQNAQTHQVDKQIEFVEQDLLTLNASRFTLHDIIVSNPPYISSSTIETLDPNVQNFEPREALDGGVDGLAFYRKIGEVAKSLLKPSGFLVVEIGDDQGQSVPEIFSSAGLKNVRVIKDYAGLDRVVVASL